MKREIKFRAWNDSKKDWEGNFSISRIGSFLRLGISQSTEGIHVMQYTGLKDMHGKEIYEGDIVTWSDGEYKHYSNPRIAVVEFNPELSFYAVNVVEHSGTCKYTKRDNHGHKFGYSNFAYANTENHLEVAGNIYENRNLLDY